MQFRIAQLGIVIAGIAVALGLLVYADQDGVSGRLVSILVYVQLVAGVVAWVCGNAAWRAMGAAFVLGCGSYLMLIGDVLPLTSSLGEQISVRPFWQAILPAFQQRSVPNPHFDELLARGLTPAAILKDGVPRMDPRPKSWDFEWMGRQVTAIFCGWMAVWWCRCLRRKERGAATDDRLRERTNL